MIHRGEVFSVKFVNFQETIILNARCVSNKWCIKLWNVSFIIIEDSCIVFHWDDFKITSKAATCTCIRVFSRMIFIVTQLKHMITLVRMWELHPCLWSTSVSLHVVEKLLNFYSLKCVWSIAARRTFQRIFMYLYTHFRII